MSPTRHRQLVAAIAEKIERARGMAPSVEEVAHVIREGLGRNATEAELREAIARLYERPGKPDPSPPTR